MCLKNYTPFFFYSFVLAVSLSSCAVPQAVVRVEPTADQKVRWDYGQAIVEKSVDSLFGRAAFDHAEKEFLVFNVDVTNLSQRDLLVAPELFYITTSTGTRYFALDPEKQLFSMEVQENVREANAKNAAVLAGVVAAAAVTAVVVSEIKDAKENRNNNSNSNNENRNNNQSNTNFLLSVPLVINSSSADQSIAQSNIDNFEPNRPTTRDRDFWTDYTLRKTTLAPGEKARGKVLFSRQDALKDFLLMLPVEQSVFSFGFKQKVFQPQ
ncbi:hypothetical protein [Haliscomenobacter sp.]|uniref:hypothetical protein n=1 Tax=Haliscomenobacter sp. TaxID=2717303 RepID=UPI0033651D3E